MEKNGKNWGKNGKKLGKNGEKMIISQHLKLLPFTPHPLVPLDESTIEGHS